VEDYNNDRLNRLPDANDMLAGCHREIHAERDGKLEAARQQRQSDCQEAV